eukprot:CAMPEP_0119532266 /NCGR_PEP_ID=MMETSP1344-20130328/45821_1 /TAXON_ID=236787 /ORGANISM="Florenciella parvula, Strain CCMP2471" /LENGTH=76 /DNA_ID=CAMNT_0007572735 /DNA_START=113 /DNA_END=341 /DNA_ORIENTATION=+
MTPKERVSSLPPMDGMTCWARHPGGPTSARAAETSGSAAVEADPARTRRLAMTLAMTVTMTLTVVLAVAVAVAVAV